MGYFKNLVIEEQERELQEEILQGNCTQEEEDEYAALLWASRHDNDADLDDIVEDLMEETCDAEVRTMNERKRQELREEQLAKEAGRRTLRVWRFLCSDNVDFAAIAPSESGAFRVLNAERPGVTAQTMGFTEVPAR